MSKNDAASIQLGCVVLPEYSSLALSAVIEPLFVANWLAQRALFTWRVYSVSGKAVRASNGRRTGVDGDLSAAQSCSTVFVLASFEPERVARDARVARALRRMARSGLEIGGIENGTLALADAGLLDAHEAAIHWDNREGFAELYPQLRTTQSRFSFSPGRVTCAGAAAIIEMMVVWIRGRKDAQLAADVARHLLVREPDPPETRTEAPSATAPSAVALALELMRSHLDEPVSCAHIAHRSNISQRQLERQFKQRFGRSLHQHYLLLRMERAHRYLQQTRLSVTEVALASGSLGRIFFASVQTVVRAKSERRPPSGDGCAGVSRASGSTLS